MRTFDSDFEHNLYHDRLQTLDKIADLGEQMGRSRAEAVYPNRFPRTGEADLIPQLRATYDHAPAEEFDLALAEGKPIHVAVAGRIMAIRAQGKAGFAQLQGGGQRLQIYVRKDSVGDTAFALYKLLDLGDHIGVHGYLFRTRTGELTVHVGPGPTFTPGGRPEPPITFLAKAMLALPDKYHGLEDVELRYRQRYVDLIMNSGTSTKQQEHGPATQHEHGRATQQEQGPATQQEQGPATQQEQGPATAISAEAPGKLSSRPERSEVEGPASPASSPTLQPPELTETAPNEEHNDAPRNVREVFVKRAQILRSIRRFFDERGYLEVETPMMHTIAGGAAARPFKTHHNALDIPLSLRIAPELYLKRLVVGGLDRVYEINRNFRNEGVSTQHNPEFTMLEFYQAYANYHDLMDLTQELVTRVATEVNGTPITHFNGHEIDLSQWQKLSMREAIILFWPETAIAPSLNAFSDRFALAKYFRTASKSMASARAANGDTEDAVWIDDTVPSTPEGRKRRRSAEIEVYFEGVAHVLETDDSKTRFGKVIAEVFEALAEEHLTMPTIIYDFPLAVSPLSKQKPDEPDWVERFEFYIGGFEVGNAFSELNDPEEQRKRFEQQLGERDRGDDEAHAMDEDYVRALGYGLPPTAGEGIGIDRLTMLLTGSRSIRDVILFPLMRPHTKSPVDPPTSS